VPSTGAAANLRNPERCMAWGAKKTMTNSTKPAGKAPRCGISSLAAAIATDCANRRGRPPPPAAARSPMHDAGAPARLPGREAKRKARAYDVECPLVKNVGEPCAGAPHARFDGGGRNQASRAVQRRGLRLPPTPDHPSSSLPTRREAWPYRAERRAGPGLSVSPFFSRLKIVWGSLGTEPGGGTLRGFAGVGGVSRRGGAAIA
jgi:hypothetical protein